MTNIVSWNVNGIRAVQKKGLWQPFLDKCNPDIICLQEIKAKPEQLDIDTSGYYPYWNSAQKAGYSGTAILSRQEALSIQFGLPEEIIQRYHVVGDKYGDPSSEGRIIAAEYEAYWLVTVYTPNAKEDLSRLALRSSQWDPAFLAYMLQLEKIKPVIFCGDLNVAHTEDDLANPKPNLGKKGFTDEERSGFDSFVDSGFIDSFRLFTKGNGYYTWWSHFARARERNVGWRIDYFLVSSSLKSLVKSAQIYPDILGSDHCPISLTLA